MRVKKHPIPSLNTAVNKFKPRQPIQMSRDDRNVISKDSELIDQLVRQHIETGGVVVYAYRYLGTPPQSRDIVNVRINPGVSEQVDFGSFLGIEDPLYMENRDRVYDFDDIPRLRGVFKVSQNDLIYGRFGPQGLNNDVYSIEFHTRTIESNLGRRFIIGDVLEFPHLKDISVDGRKAPKLYEVARVMRSPTGWDQHYVNHVLALILRPVRDSQEFIQFMERTNEYGELLVDQISTGPNIVSLNDAMAEKARELAPTGIWDTTQEYLDPHDKNKRPDWTDDGHPPDGIVAQSGAEFPPAPKEFDYFLRTNFVPNRLFQFYDNRWNIKQIDRHLEWQNYGWIAKWQEFLAARSRDDK